MFLFLAGDRILFRDDRNKMRYGTIICTTTHENSWYIVECTKWWFWKEWLWVHKLHIVKKIPR